MAVVAHVLAARRLSRMCWRPAGCCACALMSGCILIDRESPRSQFRQVQPVLMRHDLRPVGRGRGEMSCACAEGGTATAGDFSFLVVCMRRLAANEKVPSQ